MVRAGLLQTGFLVAGAIAGTLKLSPAKADEFIFPAACTMGSDCFIQMMPDLDPGPKAMDPFCGSTTRNAYPGTDLRLRSMAEMRRGVGVFAMADGTVIEARDGMRDQLVRNRQTHNTVAGRECGNGLAIDHGEGVTAHYCHMRRGSITISAGDHVSAGQKIGEIGASGLAPYPKLHVAVFRNGVVFDPFSGLEAGDDCISSTSKAQPIFGGNVVSATQLSTTRLLASGLTGSETTSGQFVQDGPPPPATDNSKSLIAWGWMINVQAGDRVRVTLYGPAGGVMASQTTLPASRSRPEVTVFAGRRGKPVPGSYRVVVDLLRDGEVKSSDDRLINITG